MPKTASAIPDLCSSARWIYIDDSGRELSMSATRGRAWLVLTIAGKEIWLDSEQKMLGRGFPAVYLGGAFEEQMVLRYPTDDPADYGPVCLRGFTSDVRIVQIVDDFLAAIGTGRFKPRILWGTNQDGAGRRIDPASAEHISKCLQNVPGDGRLIGLVSCVSLKSADAKPAAELYISPLFRHARRYVATRCDRWFILSAKYGLVLPEQAIEPYDLTLNEMKRNARKEWSTRVTDALQRELGPGDRTVLLAGEKYREFVEPWLLHNGFVARVPMRGLSIGSQLQWLKNQNENGTSNPSTSC